MTTKSNIDNQNPTAGRRNLHDDIIPLFLEIPGREMIMNICNGQEIWRDWNEREKPEILFYHSHGEFSLGHCGENGEVGRIDSVISIRPPESVADPYKGSLIGLELKASIKDLKKDSKLNGKYLQSKMCDYYYVCAFNDDIAAAAVVKYADCYNIGVASLSSGRVFKTAGKSKIASDARKRYCDMLTRRSAAIETMHPNKRYFKQDLMIAMLLTGSNSQISPTFTEALKNHYVESQNSFTHFAHFTQP